MSLLNPTADTRPGWMLANGVPGTILTIWPKLMKAIGPIAKAHAAEGASYKYRSIDDVIARLQPALVKHKVTTAVSTTNLRRQRIGGHHVGSLSSVEIHAQLRFIAQDGSWLALEADGEAFDNSDKGVAKAITGAIKTALLHGLMIPVSDPTRDPDAHRIEPAPTTLSDVSKALIERIKALTDAESISAVMQSEEYRKLPRAEGAVVRSLATERWTELLTQERAGGPKDWPKPTSDLPIATRS